MALPNTVAVANGKKTKQAIIAATEAIAKINLAKNHINIMAVRKFFVVLDAQREHLMALT
jgi:hypothetical protein